MRSDRFLTAAILTLLAAAPAWAQQAQPLPPLGPQPVIGATPLTPPPAQFAAPPPDLTAREALTGAAVPPIKTQATLCVRPVMVDDEVRTWDHLQEVGGAKPAWDAYMLGDYVRAVPVFERLAKVGHPEAERLMGNVYYFGQGRAAGLCALALLVRESGEPGLLRRLCRGVVALSRRQKGRVSIPARPICGSTSRSRRLPDSVERDAMIKERGKIEALMSACSDRSGAEALAIVLGQAGDPPDVEDLPVDYFPKAVN